MRRRHRRTIAAFAVLLLSSLASARAFASSFPPPSSSSPPPPPPPTPSAGEGEQQQQPPPPPPKNKLKAIPRDLLIKTVAKDKEKAERLMSQGGGGDGGEGEGSRIGIGDENQAAAAVAAVVLDEGDSKEAEPEEYDTAWDSFREVFMKSTVPYYFLRDELGINENTMLRISLDHGQVLALSVERSLRPKVNWLRKTLKLNRAEAANLVGASPGLLLLSIEDNLTPKLRWLVDELGLTEEERRKLVMKCPQILTAGTGSLLMKLAFLKEDVGLSPQDLQRAFKMMPSLLVLSLDTLVDKTEYLTTEFGLTLKDVGPLLIRAPALFFQAIDTGLKPKVRFLRKELGFDTEDLRQLIRRTPRVLNYGVVTHGRPFLQYLTRVPFTFSREEVAKMVQRSPALLATDVGGARFVSLIQTLKEATGVINEGELMGILQRFPMVMSFTAGRVRESVDVLVEDLGCDSEEVAVLLRKHPQLLGYRPEAVRVKLEAVQALYELESLREVKPALLKAPALLSYSLETRLRPRLALAREAGVSLEKAVGWLPLSEGKYEERLERSTTEPLSLVETPLLRQRSNAGLRKFLRKKKTDSGDGMKM